MSNEKLSMSEIVTFRYVYVLAYVYAYFPALLGKCTKFKSKKKN